MSTTTTTDRNGFNQLLFDIFVTALEGGIGYWSQCSAYHWQGTDGQLGDEDILGFRAVIHDDDDQQHVIDRDVIAKGWHLATSQWRHTICWSSGDKPPIVVTADYDGEWDFDAMDADIIVQLGLFGEVIYG